VLYAARRGFYFVLPKPGAKQKDGGVAGPLPRGFVVLEFRGTVSVSCTTHELNALNSRLKDASNDCLLLTEQVFTRDQLQFKIFVKVCWNAEVTRSSAAEGSRQRLHAAHRASEDLTLSSGKLEFAGHSQLGLLLQAASCDVATGPAMPLQGCV